MSDEIAKEKHSKRLYSEEVKIQKQVKIAKAYGRDIKQPHRLAKHHVMNCGTPECMVCGNPRKTFNEPTIQEKSFDQTKTWYESDIA